MAKQDWTDGQTVHASDLNAEAAELNAVHAQSDSQTAAVNAVTAATADDLDPTSIHAATAETTPADLDELVILDSAAAFGPKKLTWASLKAVIKSYIDTVSTTFTNKSLTNATFTNYTETVVPIGVVTTAAALSLTSGTVQTATLTASTGCTFTMPTPSAGKSFVLYLKQPTSTGNGSATFTGVKWPGGTAPTITTTAGGMDILAFVADGTNWYGSFTQNYTY